MFSGKAKLLGKYALESGLYFLKRAFVSPPSKIDTIVVDLDYTLIETLTAYRALEMMLGPDGAKEAYAKQKALVKSGKANFADVKNWGHLLQMQKGWTARDWMNVVDRAYDEQLVNWSVVGALQQIKQKNPNVKIILSTGTSDVLGKRFAAHLRGRLGVRVDAVVGSKQTFEQGPHTGKVTGLVRFVGESHQTIPSIEKIPAIREYFTRKGWVFNPKTTMAISDADPQLLRKCGVGVLVPVGKSEDPASYISQKFKLRDVEFVKGQSPLQLVNLVLNPQGKLPLKGSVQARRPRRRARIGRLSPYSRQNRRRP